MAFCEESMDKKLEFKERVSLKLTNALIYSIDENYDNVDINLVVEKMKNYIRVKGASQIGPVIQHTKLIVGEDRKISTKISFILQCDRDIHSVEKPTYMFKTKLYRDDMLYCRYKGSETQLKIAYEKIDVEAFERNIILENNNYTVYIQFDQSNDYMVADIFVPRAQE